jgi:serine protease AprX
MRFTHNLFNNPSHIDFRRDCINGGANCNTGASLNPNDDCWDHGTSSAAIISGNDRAGDAFRGVTAITLDSFKVYPTSFDATGLCNGNLSVTAAVRGFQTAVAVLDRVIVAEMQAGGSDTGTISTAADNAFDAGAMIIAANGNNGPAAATVNEPAIAHNVIGVGNFDVQTLAQITGQSRGAAPDNRFKPDIQAPTNTETASNGCGWRQNCTAGGSDTAFRVFGGTSGSTPYAAGAAALLRNWLRGTSFSLDPGQGYVQLILSGQQPYPFNNTTGAGPIRLPTDGWAWWG